MIIDKLNNDHINFQKVLSLLSEQVSLLEKCDDSCLELVLDIIKYMKDYPDFTHHPLEDEIFKHYLQHNKTNKRKFTHLLQEHIDMLTLTQELIEMLEGAIAGQPESREKLCNALREYLAIQTEHINTEETDVFPILRSTFDDAEWQQIDVKVRHVVDPLFGNELTKAYENLYQRIFEAK